MGWGPVRLKVLPPELPCLQVCEDGFAWGHCPRHLLSGSPAGLRAAPQGHSSKRAEAGPTVHAGAGRGRGDTLTRRPRRKSWGCHGHRGLREAAPVTSYARALRLFNRSKYFPLWCSCFLLFVYLLLKCSCIHFPPPPPPHPRCPHFPLLTPPPLALSTCPSQVLPKTLPLPPPPLPLPPPLRLLAVHLIFLMFACSLHLPVLILI